MNKAFTISACLLFSVYLNLGCSDNKGTVATTPVGSDTSYKVYKIDSLNNWYLIYASKKGKRFKIVSKKEWREQGQKIESGGYYDFDLYSIYAMIVDGKDIAPVGFYGLRIDSITTIWREPEDSIYDAFWAENIKGLFFERKK